MAGPLFSQGLGCGLEEGALGGGCGLHGFLEIEEGGGDAIVGDEEAFVESDGGGCVDGLDEIGVGAVCFFGAGFQVKEVAEGDHADRLDAPAGFLSDFTGGGLLRGFAGFRAASDDEVGDAAGHFFRVKA